jgi:hypothetical protein
MLRVAGWHCMHSCVMHLTCLPLAYNASNIATFIIDWHTVHQVAS